MEQVTLFQSGERNYYNIRGGTGPLVYPAGFLFLYSLLQSFTGGGHGSDGSDASIYTGQKIFVGIYIFQAAIVLTIYTIISSRHVYHLEVSSTKKDEHTDSVEIAKANEVWSWRIAMVMCCLSKRIHSIFILRLFNDGPAMTLMYLSVLLFIYSRWKLGCFVYSMAVSIKMNILLFAPGLLLLLLQSQSNLFETIQCLGICALVQLIVGWPFLAKYPTAYIRKSFELDRVFMFKWTVNWKVGQKLRYAMIVHIYYLLSIFLIANSFLPLLLYFAVPS